MEKLASALEVDFAREERTEKFEEGEAGGDYHLEDVVCGKAEDTA